MQSIISQEHNSGVAYWNLGVRVAAYVQFVGELKQCVNRRWYLHRDSL